MKPALRPVNRLCSYLITVAFTSAVMLASLAHAAEADSTAFQDEYGQRLFLTSFKGKPLIVHFWASWCGPCIMEMASLVKMQADHGAQGLQIIALSEDDSPEDVTRFHKQHPEITFPLYWDIDQRISNTLRINALPTSIIVGKDGVQLQRLEGGMDWQQPEMDKFLTQWLTSL